MMALIFMVTTYVGRVRVLALAEVLGRAESVSCDCAQNPAVGRMAWYSNRPGPRLTWALPGRPWAGHWATGPRLRSILLGAGGAPWPDHAGPLGQRLAPRRRRWARRRLVTLGQVRGVALQSCPCLAVQIGQSRQALTRCERHARSGCLPLAGGVSHRCRWVSQQLMGGLRGRCPQGGNSAATAACNAGSTRCSAGVLTPPAARCCDCRATHGPRLRARLLTA